MNRRNFLGLLGMGVAGLALDHAIPFNRVWSFPKEIVIAPAWVYDARDAGLYVSLHGIPYFAEVPPSVGTFYGIQRNVINIEDGRIVSIEC